MKTDNKKILFVVILVLVLGALYFSLKEDDVRPLEVETEMETETEETQTKRYESDTYAFSFEYPERYEILEYTPTRISVGESTARGFVSVADIALIQSEVDNMQSFEEFVLDQARLTCTEEEESSISCLEITDLKPYSGPEGSDAQTFYLVAETTRGDSGQVLETRRGPYYTFNTSPNTLGLMSFLMVYNPVHRVAEEADRGTLETIVRTLVISERQYR